MTQDVRGGAVIRTVVSEETLIRIEPYIAHAFVLLPGSKMTCYSSEPFNEDDKDMFPHKLI